jgi:glycerophosphoryl diester phosphodiesterase
MQIFGHRGARGHAPENTMAAFRFALEMGCDGIELDIQLTKDGRVVVCHDHTIDRTSNGSGWLVKYTFNELRELDFGSWFDSRFHGERIPTLREVLQWASTTPLRVNIEIKNGPVIYDGIEEKTIALVRECRMKDRVIVSSFFHPSLMKVKQLEPDITTGLLFASRPIDPWLQLRSTDTDYLHPHWHYVDAGWTTGIRPKGAKVLTWTVNEPEEWNFIKDSGVDGIFTDFPDRFVGIKQEQSSTWQEA